MHPRAYVFLDKEFTHGPLLGPRSGLVKRSLPFLTTFAIALALASAREVNRDGGQRKPHASDDEDPHDGYARELMCCSKNGKKI